VSWAGDEPEKLRHRVQKVENLWQKEEQHCFAEVSKDADHRKGHSRKVAERVSHKHSAGIPVMSKSEV
jgi:hypothetical protein